MIAGTGSFLPTLIQFIPNPTVQRVANTLAGACAFAASTLAYYYPNGVVITMPWLTGPGCAPLTVPLMSQ